MVGAHWGPKGRFAAKGKPVVIEFKNPDFADALRSAGVGADGMKRLLKLAEFGEYWKLELMVGEDGVIYGAKFVDAKE